MTAGNEGTALAAPRGRAPRVSVVTPVYNTIEYLGECIESVLGQTYGDFEYVIVDNCSTDGSAELALSYAARDPRVRVVRADAFRKQVPNYNYALSQIDGHSVYVKMVEADNALRPDCLQKMVELADRHPAVTVVGSYNVTETRVRFHGLRTDVEVVPGREAARLHLEGRGYLFGAPTSVLLRAAPVRARRKFFAEEFPHGDDQAAVLELLDGGDFGFIHQVLTFVRTENISYLTGVRPFENGELDKYALFMHLGRRFFEPAEFEAVLAGHRRAYYEGLAARVFTIPVGELLAWHDERLALFHMRVSRAAFAGALARRALRAIGNPLDTLAGALRGR
jgi:glycosyltransferase involved in cell wall biosynthesis